MLLVIASSIYREDPQINLITKKLGDEGVDFVLINPLDYNDLIKIEISFSHDYGNRILYEGKALDITKVYVTRHFRPDCIINIPERCGYSTLYRHKVELFLQELCAALSDKKWFPGNIENIIRGEQKCFIYNEVHKAGLLTPKMTINSFLKPGEIVYKKSLGFPFTITHDDETGNEVAVTLNNEISTSEEEVDIPWQWQTHIKPKTQIRCVYVSGKIWAFSASEKQFDGKSLREVQSDKKIVWNKIRLSNKIKSKIDLVMVNLGLEYSCPEFLVTEDEQHHFIDLNSCGDWFGFGSQKDNNAIAEAIVSKLCD